MQTCPVLMPGFFMDIYLSKLHHCILRLSVGGLTGKTLVWEYKRPAFNSRQRQIRGMDEHFKWCPL